MHAAELCTSSLLNPAPEGGCSAGAASNPAAVQHKHAGQLVRGEAGAQGQLSRAEDCYAHALARSRLLKLSGRKRLHPAIKRLRFQQRGVSSTSFQFSSTSMHSWACKGLFKIHGVHAKVCLRYAAHLHKGCYILRDCV